MSVRTGAKAGERGAKRAYLVGGGIGSLAAAAFMIRDGNIPGENVTIYEATPLLGAVLTAAATRKMAARCAADRC